ncbi:MAG: ABC transporter ATP-binding protein, partial [Anaerolineae bacterium]|nr:ABC transporter ATP-binding protein [Anaerolineae bacterium]
MNTVKRWLKHLFASKEAEELDFELPETLQHKSYDSRIARRLLGYIRPYWRQMALALVLMGLVTGAALTGPYLIKMALDNAIDQGNLHLLRWLVAAFVGVNIVAWLARAAQVSVVVEAGQMIIYQIRKELFEHLQRQSLGFFDRADVGVLMSRVTSDVGRLQDLVTWAIVGTAADLFTLVGIVIAMVSLNAYLSMITFTVLPIMFLITAIWRVRARDNWRRVRYYNGRLLGYLEENIHGVRVVQAFTREALNLKQFVEEVNRNYLHAQLKAAKLSAIFFPSIDFLGSTAIALAIGFGGSAVLGKQVTPGVLVAFIMYIDRFFNPIRDLAQRYNTLQLAMAAGERIFNLLDRPPDIQNKPGAIELPPIKGEVIFDHVHFAYEEGVPVLQDINLHVKPGQMVAFVGATGAGKSSLALLLGRFYEVSSGRILIDGYD